MPPPPMPPPPMPPPPMPPPPMPPPPMLLGWRYRRAPGGRPSPDVFQFSVSMFSFSLNFFVFDSRHCTEMRPPPSSSKRAHGGSCGACGGGGGGGGDSGTTADSPWKASRPWKMSTSPLLRLIPLRGAVGLLRPVAAVAHAPALLFPLRGAAVLGCRGRAEEEIARAHVEHDHAVSADLIAVAVQAAALALGRLAVQGVLFWALPPHHLLEARGRRAARVLGRKGVDAQRAEELLLGLREDVRVAHTRHELARHLDHLQAVGRRLHVARAELEDVVRLGGTRGHRRGAVARRHARAVERQELRGFDTGALQDMPPVRAVEVAVDDGDGAVPKVAHHYLGVGGGAVDVDEGAKAGPSGSACAAGGGGHLCGPASVSASAMSMGGSPGVSARNEGAEARISARLLGAAVGVAVGGAGPSSSCGPGSACDLGTATGGAVGGATNSSSESSKKSVFGMAERRSAVYFANSAPPGQPILFA
eukprot:scaffold89413_cov66-Phaeocystis_antarctica.AAC.5